MLLEDPQDAFLHYGLAMEHVGEGNDEAAVYRLRQLFAVAPDYVPGFQQLAQALIRLRRPDEAQKVLRNGIEQAKKQGDSHAWEEMRGLLSSLE
jgi:hypothetical protein